jgi:sulfate-transporting ATPase
MGFAVVISSVVLSNTDWNGGAIRGTRVPDPTIFGINIQSVVHPELWAFLCLVVLLFCALMTSNLRRGRSGRRLIAVRDNERAAASLGVSTFVAKLYAFAVGAGLAGVGGVLLAFRNTSVDFGQYSPFASIEIVLLVVIGGVGFIIGGIAGALGVVAGVVHEIFGLFLTVDEWFRFILALMFLVAIVIHPDGFAEYFSRHLAKGPLRKRRTSKSAGTHERFEITPVIPKELNVQDLKVQFGGVVAVDHVSFAVTPGRVLGLIGPNGAGKTTVVDAVSGFLTSYRGSVSLNGQSIDRLKASKRARAGITRSFQSLELFEDLSVSDNLRISADDGKLRHLFFDLIRQRSEPLSSTALVAVQEFGLQDVLDKRPGELSYAMRRAVAIARAVAAQPSVLLLDEPAAGLDGVARAELERLIRRLADEWKMAVLLIEHDVSMVMSTCDEVLVLDFGRELAYGPPNEIQSNEAVVVAYLGEEATTLASEPIAGEVNNERRTYEPAE